MILNCTQHTATPEQQQDGVTKHCPRAISALLDFRSLPSRSTLEARAIKIAQLAACHGTTHAMIGGAPYFMAYLEQALKNQGVTPLYSFCSGDRRHRLHRGFIEA